jgi:type II secretory pathway component PulF
MTASAVITFTQQMSDLLSGGVSLPRCLEIIRRQHRGAFHRDTLGEVLKDLQGGHSFSEALARHEQLFSPLYLGVVRAGESSGNLERAFARLTEHLGREADLKRKTQRALAYPLIVLILCATVSLFLTAFVIPRFHFLFDDLGQRLPWPTRLMVAVSSLVRDHGPIVLPIIGVFLVSFRRSSLPFWPHALEWLGRHRWLRPILVRPFVARWTGTMAALLGAGFTVSEGLQLTRQSLRAHPYSRELGTIEKRISTGWSLSRALSETGLFPPVVHELVAASEESGGMEQTLSRLASTLERESDELLHQGVNLLEPALILVTASVVGFVALAMLLPIFEMSGSMR